jgi:hypothetical protein
VTVAVGLANVVLGVVYTSYGVMTILDMKRGCPSRRFSHFGMAWIAVTFTCGPHFVDHGLVLLFVTPRGGPLDVAAVLAGFPAAAVWFLLRVEALRGGRGDRFVSGTPRWVRALACAGALGVGATAAAVAAAARAAYGPKLTPGFLLLGLYGLIGWYLLQTQVTNRKVTGGWSVSGLALTMVFPTCGLTLVVVAMYAARGRYAADPTALAIDWLAVPAAVYFVWVVRSLHVGGLSGRTRGAVGLPPIVGGAV